MAVVGLLPDVFWGLTWADYDDLLYNHRFKEQQALLGHRMVAAQVYNAMQGFATTPKGKSPADYWPLPLLDPPPPPPPPDTWWAHMKDLAARTGKRFLGTTD